MTGAFTSRWLALVGHVERRSIQPGSTFGNSVLFDKQRLNGD